MFAIFSLNINQAFHLFFWTVFEEPALPAQILEKMCRCGIRIIPWPSMDGSKAKQVYSARDTVGGNWSGVATNRQELFPFTLLWPIISKGWLLDKIRKVLPLARDVPSVTDKSPSYIMGEQSATSWLILISSLCDLIVLAISRDFRTAKEHNG